VKWDLFEVYHLTKKNKESDVESSTSKKKLLSFTNSTSPLNSTPAISQLVLLKSSS